MNIIAIVETEAGLVVQDFVWKMIELHDKYLAYVNDCFQNHTIFHKALKESFEVFCNKGSWSAELLATFSDVNILIASRPCLKIVEEVEVNQLGYWSLRDAKVNSSELTMEAKLELAKADNQKLRDMVKVAKQEKEAALKAREEALTDGSRLELEVKLREEKLKLEKVGLGALQGIDQAVANLKAQIHARLRPWEARHSWGC
ncbi:hypothetical protein AHAS_Ahas17G0225800 [Arachis hypogaea]